MRYDTRTGTAAGQAENLEGFTFEVSYLFDNGNIDKGELLSSLIEIVKGL